MLFLRPSSPVSEQNLLNKYDSLVRVGDGNYILYQYEQKNLFEDWYTTTQWYLDSKTPECKYKLPVWNSSRKSSDIWKAYDQIANIRSGKPLLRCKGCKKTFDHSSTALSGSTTSYSNHLNSKDCKKLTRLNMEPNSQLSIQESLQAQGNVS